MTHQFESLIDPKQLNRDLICQLLNESVHMDMFVVFDEIIDTLMISFKDPKKIDTATYNVSEKFAYVVDIENLEIVGFWLIRFSKYWLETGEFRDLKSIWPKATEKGIFFEYKRVSVNDHKKSFRNKNKELRHNSEEANLFIQDIFKSNEIKEEFCLV